MQDLTSDTVKRAPAWVAAAVSKTYGIKKSEISGGKIGRVKVVDNSSLMTAKIIYSGRPLTPTHFGMTPTTLKAPNGTASYTLKANIIRGQKTVLGKPKKLTKKQRKMLGKNFTRSGSKTSDHSPIMLMYTGNTREGGTNYIPFQRKSTNRKDIKAIKTTSLPQMVSSERTRKDIEGTLTENIEKRLAHYVKRHGF